MLDKFMLGMFYAVGSSLIALIIVSIITISLINAPQYRVNVVNGSISILKG
jgi:hypothetical protein